MLVPLLLRGALGALFDEVFVLDDARLAARMIRELEHINSKKYFCFIFFFGIDANSGDTFAELLPEGNAVKEVISVSIRFKGLWSFSLAFTERTAWKVCRKSDQLKDADTDVLGFCESADSSFGKSKH